MKVRAPKDGVNVAWFSCGLACVKTVRGLRLAQRMKRVFTAVIKQDEGWWIGWVAEIPGVNCQGKTRRELTQNLRSALKEAIEFNRADALSAAKGDYEQEPILV